MGTSHGRTAAARRSATLVLTHRAQVRAERVRVHGYPIRLTVGGITIACDEPTADRLLAALVDLLVNNDPGPGIPLAGGGEEQDVVVFLGPDLTPAPWDRSPADGEGRP